MSDTAPHADCAAIIREVNGLQTVVPLCKHRQEVIDTGLREYMALEADRDALAAENAALRSLLDEARNQRTDAPGFVRWFTFWTVRVDAAIDAAKGAQPEAAKWTHGCQVAGMNLDLWLDRCPQCGKPRDEGAQG
jgi:hypothetical protein